MEEIISELDRIEEAIAKGKYSLCERDFWRIVTQVKKEPELANKFADRIGRIDQTIFRKKARISVPLKIGHFIEIMATLLIVVALYCLISSGTYTGIAILAGTFALMGTVHPLAHYMVGRAFGIRFTFYFPNGPAMIEPTIKTDYATYLKTPPIKRAVMHAAGPLICTLIIIVALAVAVAVNAPPWTPRLLAAFLVFNILFEVLPPLWVKLGIKSFTKSDTYRALREWKIHRLHTSRRA